MIRCIFGVMIVCSVAEAAPRLTETAAYTHHKSCLPVGLSGWHHPTRKVLDDAKVTLLSLDMCDRKFPIFHVSAEYAPQLRATDSFYLPFYARMWIANGRNPMAIDVANWHDMVVLRHDGKGLGENDEEYAP